MAPPPPPPTVEAILCAVSPLSPPSRASVLYASHLVPDNETKISATGISLGTSTHWNGGYDYGPDSPGTSTNGMQEAITYCTNNNVILKWTQGTFICTSPLIIPFNANGFFWEGVGWNSTNINVGNAWSSTTSDFISVALGTNNAAMLNSSCRNIQFNALGNTMTSLVNFSNPSGLPNSPGGETSTRWLVEHCRFTQLKNVTVYGLHMDFNEDSLLSNCLLSGGPTAPVSGTLGQFSWLIPGGAAAISNCVFTNGGASNVASLYLKANAMAIRDSVLGSQVFLDGNAGEPKMYYMDHIWMQSNVQGNACISTADSTGSHTVMLTLVGCVVKSNQTTASANDPLFGSSGALFTISAMGCYFAGTGGGSTANIQAAGSNLTIYDINCNYATVNSPQVSGCATYNSGKAILAGTSLAVAHGLGGVPSFVLTTAVTATPGAGTVSSVSAVNAGSFTVDMASSFSGTVYWRAWLAGVP